MLRDSSDGVALMEIDNAPHLVAERGEDATFIPGTSFNPELARTLYDVLNWVDLGHAALEAELERLEGQYHDAVFTELIFMLSHLRFPGDVARRHWVNVIDHRRRMSEKLQGDVDIRVALVSYFLEVNRSFRSPKLIEMRVFEETRASAYWDDLTGLRNYRFFSEHLHQELLRSQLTGAPVSLVMIDVDDFKGFNDTYGHEAGNEALARVAKLLSGPLGPADVVSRYGGEEFALVLTATPKHEAQSIAEHVRCEVAEHEPIREDRRLTVSLGVATSPADSKDVGELVRHADRALYAAKFGGKNQVRLFGESTRSYVRVDSRLSGTFSMQSLEWTPMETVKISEGGLQFFSRHNLVERSLLEFQLDLPKEGRPITAVGRVVRVAAATAGYEVAVQFIDLSAPDRMRLAAHLDGGPPPAGGDATNRAR